MTKIQKEYTKHSSNYTSLTFVKGGVFFKKISEPHLYGSEKLTWTAFVSGSSRYIEQISHPKRIGEKMPKDFFSQDTSVRVRDRWDKQQ